MKINAEKKTKKMKLWLKLKIDNAQRDKFIKRNKKYALEKCPKKASMFYDIHILPRPNRDASSFSSPGPCSRHNTIRLKNHF